MHVNIIALGQRMPNWVEEGVSDYLKRFRDPWRVELKLLSIPARTKISNPEKMKAKEAELITKALSKSGVIIALDERGLDLKTKQFAQNIQQYAQTNPPIHFIIGGPDGLSESLRHKADAIWSLGKLTLPHGLARLVLVEQLYRSYSILTNHPYHRE